MIRDSVPAWQSCGALAALLVAGSLSLGAEAPAGAVPDAGSGLAADDLATEIEPPRGATPFSEGANRVSASEGANRVSGNVG